MITHHVSINKINKDFYEKHSELRDHKEIVASVLEQVEGDNPPMDYEKLIDKAYPEICKQIKTVNKLDFTDTGVPTLDYNGEI